MTFYHHPHMPAYIVFTTLDECEQGGMVVWWLALSPHSK